MPHLRGHVSVRILLLILIIILISELKEQELRASQISLSLSARHSAGRWRGERVGVPARRSLSREGGRAEFKK